jgi:D-3-phosphoglycerate dehydrogenase / 2-oxoglutarate reductase
MKVVVVGDQFIPASDFRRALTEVLDSEVAVREVTWTGASREEQHAVQQVMEKEGPEAVPTPQEVVDAVGDAEVLAVHFAPVSEKVLSAGSRLRAVVVARAGVENVNVEEATRRGVAVVNLIGRNANAVAEQAVGLMLAEARDLARADAGIKDGAWPEESAGPVVELHGRTVGLVGFGQVGRRVAERLAGFDTRILVYDPYVDASEMRSRGAEKVDDIERVFGEGDFVLLHARLTDETRRFIDRRLFELMKPTAYFINNARSRMVDYDALYEILAERRIAGAALDVHEDEPLPADSPWRRLDNVTLTPHIAGSTEETLENSVRLVAEAVAEIAASGRATNTVNRPEER